MKDFFKMSFRSMNVTSGLPFYISQPLMEENEWANDVID